ncbi:MAG: hypothetical protein MZV63_23655 [Marinilabiliales bacterium]|nr:hypothetical protein [Marinilabiliales bacterium]
MLGALGDTPFRQAQFNAKPFGMITPHFGLDQPKEVYDSSMSFSRRTPSAVARVGGPAEGLMSSRIGTSSRRVRVPLPVDPMPYLIGIVLSMGVAVFARRRGIRSRSRVLPDRDDCDCVALRVVRGDERLGSDGGHRVGGDDAVRGCSRCRVHVERVDRRRGAGRPWRL